MTTESDLKNSLDDDGVLELGRKGRRPVSIVLNTSLGRDSESWVYPSMRQISLGDMATSDIAEVGCEAVAEAF
jgi:hypothetical protein